MRCLARNSPQAVGQHGSIFDLGYPNRWFSTHDEAKAYADEFGGRAWVHGKQAMVVVPETSQISGMQEALHHVQQ